MTAFIEKWNVDIGDKVQKGDVLADLFVPELREMLRTKKATVQYDSDQVRFAKVQVEVAAAEVEAAQARLDEARSILGKYEAEVERWRVQVERLEREVHRTVVDPQILLESQNQWKSDIAALKAAKAAVVRADSELLADEAKLARAKVNVAVASSNLGVAESEAKRLEAWVGYLKLLAPYDGIIVARNANTWDFVLPQTGDPTAIDRAPDLSPSGQAAPIYVVDRTDIVRVFVNVPERDADYIHVGSDARVKIWAYRDAWIPVDGDPPRLGAEHQEPHDAHRDRPAQYRQPDPAGDVCLRRGHRRAPGVLALPKRALGYAGGKTFIWQYADGRAKRTEIQTGTADGEWIEVTNRSVKTKYSYMGEKEEEKWVPIEPSDEVLIGSKLSTLTEDSPVRLAASPEPTEDGGSDDSTSEATGGG